VKIEDVQHILSVIAKYLNVFDFHNFLLVNRRTFRTLSEYVEGNELLLDIRLFSGVNEPMFKDFSAYCARISALTHIKRNVERFQKGIEETYKLLKFTDFLESHNQIEVYSSRIKIIEILKSFNLQLSSLTTFPLYAFTFQEELFELSDFELIEDKDLMRVKYSIVNASHKKSVCFDRRYEIVKIKGRQYLFFEKREIHFVLTIYSNEMDMQFFVGCFPDAHTIPCITKPIILNQNTCKNIIEQKLQKNILKKMFSFFKK
jgi:hypothetical protein